MKTTNVLITFLVSSSLFIPNNAGLDAGNLVSNLLGSDGVLGDLLNAGAGAIQNIAKMENDLVTRAGSIVIKLASNLLRGLDLSNQLEPYLRTITISNAMGPINNLTIPKIPDALMSCVVVPGLAINIQQTWTPVFCDPTGHLKTFDSESNVEEVFFDQFNVPCTIINGVLQQGIMMMGNEAISSTQTGNFTQKLLDFNVVKRFVQSLGKEYPFFYTVPKSFNLMTDLKMIFSLLTPEISLKYIKFNPSRKYPSSYMFVPGFGVQIEFQDGFYPVFINSQGFTYTFSDDSDTPIEVYFSTDGKPVTFAHDHSVLPGFVIFKNSPVYSSNVGKFQQIPLDVNMIRLTIIRFGQSFAFYSTLISPAQQTQQSTSYITKQISHKIAPIEGMVLSGPDSYGQLPSPDTLGEPETTSSISQEIIPSSQEAVVEPIIEETTVPSGEVIEQIQGETSTTSEAVIEPIQEGIATPSENVAETTEENVSIVSTSQESAIVPNTQKDAIVPTSEEDANIVKTTAASEITTEFVPNLDVASRNVVQGNVAIDNVTPSSASIATSLTPSSDQEPLKDTEDTTPIPSSDTTPVSEQEPVNDTEDTTPIPSSDTTPVSEQEPVNDTEDTTPMPSSAETTTSSDQSPINMVDEVVPIAKNQDETVEQVISPTIINPLQNVVNGVETLVDNIIKPLENIITPSIAEPSLIENVAVDQEVTASSVSDETIASNTDVTTPISSSNQPSSFVTPVSDQEPVKDTEDITSIPSSGTTPVSGQEPVSDTEDTTPIPSSDTTPVSEQEPVNDTEDTTPMPSSAETTTSSDQSPINMVDEVVPIANNQDEIVEQVISPSFINPLESVVNGVQNIVDSVVKPLANILNSGNVEPTSIENKVVDQESSIPASNIFAVESTTPQQILNEIDPSLIQNVEVVDDEEIATPNSNVIAVEPTTPGIAQENVVKPIESSEIPDESLIKSIETSEVPDESLVVQPIVTPIPDENNVQQIDTVGGDLAHSMETTIVAEETQPIDSSQITEQPIESSQVTDQPIESSQVTDQPIESSQVTSQPIDFSQVTDKSIESTQVTDKSIESSQITEQPIDSSQITYQPIESSQVTDKSIESNQITEQPVESSQIIEQPIDSSQITEQIQSSEVTEESMPVELNQKESLVTVDQEPGLIDTVLNTVTDLVKNILPTAPEQVVQNAPVLSSVQMEDKILDSFQDIDTDSLMEDIENNDVDINVPTDFTLMPGMEVEVTDDDENVYFVPVFINEDGKSFAFSKTGRRFVVMFDQNQSPVSIDSSGVKRIGYFIKNRVKQYSVTTSQLINVIFNVTRIKKILQRLPQTYTLRFTVPSYGKGKSFNPNKGKNTKIMVGGNFKIPNKYAIVPTMTVSVNRSPLQLPVVVDHQGTPVALDANSNVYEIWFDSQGAPLTIDQSTGTVYPGILIKPDGKQIKANKVGKFSSSTLDPTLYFKPQIVEPSDIQSSVKQVPLPSYYVSVSDDDVYLPIFLDPKDGSPFVYDLKGVKWENNIYFDDNSSPVYISDDKTQIFRGIRIVNGKYVYSTITGNFKQQTFPDELNAGITPVMAPNTYPSQGYVILQNYYVSLADDNVYYQIVINSKGQPFVFDANGQKHDVFFDVNSIPVCFSIDKKSVYKGYVIKNGKPQYSLQSGKFSQMNFVDQYESSAAPVMAPNTYPSQGYVILQNYYVSLADDNVYYQIVINSKGQPFVFDANGQKHDVFFDTNSIPVSFSADRQSVYKGYVVKNGKPQYSLQSGKFSQMNFVDQYQSSAAPIMAPNTYPSQGYVTLQNYYVSLADDNVYYQIVINSKGQPFVFDANGQKHDVFFDVNSKPVALSADKSVVYNGMILQQGVPQFSLTSGKFTQLNFIDQYQSSSAPVMAPNTYPIGYTPLQDNYVSLGDDNVYYQVVVKKGQPTVFDKNGVSRNVLFDSAGVPVVFSDDRSAVYRGMTLVNGTPKYSLTSGKFSSKLFPQAFRFKRYI
uniref:SERPIN domain-containing protein n=1 Tax=Rhabditophanes sp. KR3021 TaxID=114890 RepID=A0AC35UI42_9BILA